MLPVQGWSSEKTNVGDIVVPLPVPYVGIYYEGTFPFIAYSSVSPVASILMSGSTIIELQTGHSATLWGFAAIATVYGAYHAFLLDSIRPQKVPSGYNVQPCVHNTVAIVETCPEDSVLVVERCPKNTILVSEVHITPSYTDE